MSDLVDYTDLPFYVSADGRYRLSTQERRVAAMLADGFAPRVAAQHLRLPRRTIDGAVVRAIRRNRVKNLQHLIRIYREEVMPDI